MSPRQQKLCGRWEQLGRKKERQIATIRESGGKNGPYDVSDVNFFSFFFPGSTIMSNHMC